MAKSKGHSLDPALQALAQGDYVQARQAFALVRDDEAASEARRAEAARWIEATKMDRGTLLVGLGCLALFALVVFIAILKQPA